MSNLSRNGLLADATPKVYFDGTERACSPEKTWERYRKLMPQMGITRIADLTGLDTIGLPTWQSVRPMAQTLSVNQGKGTDPMAAKVSALMEAAESWHAENPVLALVSCPQSALPAEAQLLDLETLACRDPIDDECFSDVDMRWVEGVELLSGEAIFVPVDTALMDYAAPPETDFLHRNSNGLASGNTLTEATVAALLEVIERDCNADFMALRRPETDKRKLKQSAVAAALPEQISAGLAKAGTHVQVWDMTNDIGVPAYYAVLRGGKAPFSSKLLRGFGGAGCHLNPKVALSRAVCEAIQSRLTVISGARDDLSAADYLPDPSHSLVQTTTLMFDVERGMSMNHSNLATPTSAGDLQLLLDILDRVGITQVCVVDLTHPELNLAVARVAVPGLGYPIEDETYRIGRRHKEGLA